ncbi:hypothetical protein [Bhargavaea beijingensis]|uniref:Uncharacterized protein n=1 Tax=Bhargavaea beijingensis TaxID=426756 RepID=A0A1G7E307_9BACL|nr:hypothetical protein [Bhargavaea beijingensis]MCW1927487.1 hypothetical protein [Bhargavaea beijingensis]RSK34955.1 hypothetical protein EJA12_04575 [Bhargavaea beijingensis]SDE58104.1 hypothetical protein SAMN04488126_11244 [Bhargavaea beijingensis]
MESVMGLLLGTLQLFYPLIVMSAIAFVLGLILRSWLWVLASAVLIYPDSWYIGGTPAFPWAIYVPLIPVFVAIWLFLSKKRNRRAAA